MDGRIVPMLQLINDKKNPTKKTERVAARRADGKKWKAKIVEDGGVTRAGLVSACF